MSNFHDQCLQTPPANGDTPIAQEAVSDLSNALAAPDNICPIHSYNTPASPTAQGLDYEERLNQGAEITLPGETAAQAESQVPSANSATTQAEQQESGIAIKELETSTTAITGNEDPELSSIIPEDNAYDIPSVWGDDAVLEDLWNAITTDAFDAATPNTINNTVSHGQKRVRQAFEISEAEPPLKKLKGLSDNLPEKPHQLLGQFETVEEDSRVQRGPRDPINEPNSESQQPINEAPAAAQDLDIFDSSFFDLFPSIHGSENSGWNMNLFNDAPYDSNLLDGIDLSAFLGPSETPAATTSDSYQVLQSSNESGPLEFNLDALLQENPPTEGGAPIDFSDLFPVSEPAPQNPSTRWNTGLASLGGAEDLISLDFSDTPKPFVDFGEGLLEVFPQWLEERTLANNVVVAEEEESPAISQGETAEPSAAPVDDVHAALEEKEVLPLNSVPLMQLRELRVWISEEDVVVGGSGEKIAWLPSQYRWSLLRDLEPTEALAGDELTWRRHSWGEEEEEEEGGDADVSGNTLVATPEEGVTILSNGTKVYAGASAARQRGLEEPPRTGVFRVALAPCAPLPAKGGRKRNKTRRTKRRAEEVEVAEVGAVEVAPKRQRVAGPPLMPTDKFCLVYPPPQGYPWGEFPSESYGRVMFLQKHLPVSDLAEAEKALDWWRGIWDEKGPHIAFLMGLPVGADPLGSSQRLIRYAQSLCERIGEGMGAEYAERLMSSEKKEIYGHVYYKMCLEIRRGLEEKWTRESAPAGASAPAAPVANASGRKRKAPSEGGEGSEPSVPKKPKVTTSSRKWGNDGKIIHQRGRDVGKAETKRQLKQFYDDPEKLRLQRALLGLPPE
ncbi:hypothetical protein H072_2412 [Dactylellina haptotyla CBS 200.50]|uniref:Uncharacterized protein n=1 Tax=Dactylellina haptotyla (strain CBS 200.50) TaxID=1284197 RepID=S8BVY4_DACHA|nr:hypothetical protein H072_2412 [Dactylellina haptotyla CBS 200.50]